MPSSCTDLRTALAKCLALSDCVLSGNKASDCIRPPLSDTLPTGCKQIKSGLAQCKRSQVDMRKRFRGTKRAGAPGEEGSADGTAAGLPQEEKGMLYAGRSIESVVAAEQRGAAAGESTTSQSSGERTGYEAKK